MDGTRKLFATARDFLRCKRGNIAMIFGVALVPLMIGAGAGLDFARAMMVRQQMAEALDAAALAVGSSTGMDAVKAQALAEKYFAANYTVDAAQYGHVTIAPPVFDAKGSITLTATNNMPTVLMKLININSVPVSTTSTVVWGQTKLWVALVLDNSGSMSQGDATGSKMSALKSASHQLLTVLQNAAHTPGDVKVGIVPFARSVNMGTSYVNSAFIDWGEWDAPPANSPTIDTNLGPGSACPFTTLTHGFRCRTNSSNSGSSNTNTIPASGTSKGLICPGIDDGSVNHGHGARYYNGCWDSVSTQYSTVTTTDTTVTTEQQSCKQKGTGKITCTSNSTVTDPTVTNSTTVTTAGSASNSTTTTNTSPSTTTDGAKSCDTSSPKNCTWSRTIVTTATKKVVVVTALAPFTHTWTANSHGTWGGCVTDRQRSTGTPAAQTMTIAGLRSAAAVDYDTANTQPTSGDTLFPAENPSACVDATITTLGYDWKSLSDQIDAMAPGDSTNQAIGIAHGWQMVTTGDPYGTPTVPGNTTRYIILLSDGLNTRDRWWGNGSTEGTVQDGYIDGRETTACANAKADGVVIYTIFLDIGGLHSDSAPLVACATDRSKYFKLTSNSAVVTTFNQIAQEITNVRVSM